MGKYNLQFRDKPVQSVVQRGESKFVQLSFEAGQGLEKHRVPLALTVVVLSGCVTFTVGERCESLAALDLFTVEPSVEHAIEALERSVVLLVLTPLTATSEAATPPAKLLL